MASPAEQLFHVKRVLIDHHKDPSGATQSVAILGTYTSLAAAKPFAQTALFTEGYERELFSTYAINDGKTPWPYGDGTIVRAAAPSGEIFSVSIETKPNTLGVAGDDGRVTGDLFHILQTTISYSEDRSGGRRTTEIEGTFRKREDAMRAAMTVLLDDDINKDWYSEYDEKPDDESQEAWDWGPDGVVHAVGPNGDNYLVETVAGA